MKNVSAQSCIHLTFNNFKKQNSLRNAYFLLSNQYPNFGFLEYHVTSDKLSNIFSTGHELAYNVIIFVCVMEFV